MKLPSISVDGHDNTKSGGGESGKKVSRPKSPVTKQYRPLSPHYSDDGSPMHPLTVKSGDEDHSQKVVDHKLKRRSAVRDKTCSTARKSGDYSSMFPPSERNVSPTSSDSHLVHQALYIQEQCSWIHSKSINCRTLRCLLLCMSIIIMYCTPSPLYASAIIYHYRTLWCLHADLQCTRTALMCGVGGGARVTWIYVGVANLIHDNEGVCPHK